MKAAEGTELPLQDGVNANMTKPCIAICGVSTVVNRAVSSGRECSPKGSKLYFDAVLGIKCSSLTSGGKPGLILLAAVIPDISDPRCECNMDYVPGGLSLFGFKITKKILFPIRALHVFTL